MASEIATADDLIIPFGMQPRTPYEQFYETCGAQVENVPSGVRMIVLATGSGVTATSLAYGLWRRRRVGVKLALIGVGPERSARILSTLNLLDAAAHRWSVDEELFLSFPLGQDPKFKYEAGVNFQVGTIPLHPLYEAKAFSWFTNHVRFDPESTLFWLVGPKLYP